MSSYKCSYVHESYLSFIVSFTNGEMIERYAKTETKEKVKGTIGKVEEARN